MRSRTCTRLIGLLMSVAPIAAFAQQNRTIELSVKNEGIYLINEKADLTINPGDTLLIPKTLIIKSVTLSGIHGSKEKPVVVIQQDTAARIGGYKAYGFVMHNSTFVKVVHVHVDGKGVNKGIGLLMSRGCSDYTLENCSSDNNGIGIQCKVTPDKDDPKSMFPSTIKNIRMVNCAASNNEAEGFYIGYSGGAKDSGLKAILIDSVYMNNIRAINNGWDGIQVTRTTNFVGQNFYVSGFGMKHTFGQNSGIAIQSDVTGSLDGFEVSEGDGAGLTIFARGNLKVKNGKMKNVGKATKIGDGIYVNDFPSGYDLPPLQLNLENIVIDGYGRFPINVVNKFRSMKPGAFKNVTYRNGVGTQGISDRSNSKK